MNRYLLKPDWQPGISVTEIDHQSLLDMDLKALILDVDGTLLPRKEKFVVKSVEDWIIEAKTHFEIHLFSNNPYKNRIQKISEQLNLSFTHRARKPSRTKLKKTIEKYTCHPSQIAMIGDRVFTDVLSGNKLDLYTILVKPIDKYGLPINNSIFQRFEIRFAKLLGAYKQ